MRDSAAPGALGGAGAIAGLRGPVRLHTDPPVTLRPAEARDAAAQRVFYLAHRAPEFAGLPEPLRTTIVEGQFRAREQSYAQAFPDLAALVLTSLDTVEEERLTGPSEGEGAGAESGLVGQMLLARDPADPTALRIVDIAIAWASRGRGIGGGAIEHVAGAARAAGYAALTLQVADDNPGARRLYDRLGFAPDGSAPDASTLALTMRRPLL